MNSIDIKMNSIEVKSKTRTLRSTWTREMADDIQSLTDLDMSSFEKYIAKEIRKTNRIRNIKKIFN